MRWQIADEFINQNLENAIRIDHKLHVKFFCTGSPEPLLQWFWYGQNFKLTKKAALENFRSSRPEMSCKKRIANFMGKQLCQSLFFSKVAGPRPATSLKKRLRHRWFPVNFRKFLRTLFLQNTFWNFLSYLNNQGENFSSRFEELPPRQFRKNQEFSTWAIV